ncbi:hypothetical protein AK812_SmicGene30903 [Symbiodinium microadriaticum]|uniref:Uncharacterized protein n=1 Tax=Symbiodinium microadriaticum TaxID=2951 RepID=A0A1Q9CY63_SYMMI|nr:hypothetical protein AK812_SmicGene30903 [Symbiodinium microadriaticum]
METIGRVSLRKLRRWHHATPAEHPAQGFGLAVGFEIGFQQTTGEAAPVVLKLGQEAIAEGDFQRALEAAKKGAQIAARLISAVAVTLPTAGAFCSQEEEVQLSWHFVQLVQRGPKQFEWLSVWWVLACWWCAQQLQLGRWLLAQARSSHWARSSLFEASGSRNGRLVTEDPTPLCIFVPVDCLQRIDDLAPDLDLGPWHLWIPDRQLHAKDNHGATGDDVDNLVEHFLAVLYIQKAGAGGRWSSDQRGAAESGHQLNNDTTRNLGWPGRTYGSGMPRFAAFLLPDPRKVPRLERMPAGSAKALRLQTKGFDGAVRPAEYCSKSRSNVAALLQKLVKGT